METLKNVIAALKGFQISEWFSWKKIGNAVFFLIGIIAAATALIFISATTTIKVLGIIAALIIFISLKAANVMIMSTSVRGGWAGIILSVFMISSSLFTLTNVIKVHSIGLLIAIFLCSLIFVFIPKISALLKLRDADGEIVDSNWNGGIGVVFLFIIIFCINGVEENAKFEDALFERTPFVKVKDWWRENYRGDTYYIVRCSKGTFAIDPIRHPEIRNITSKTQIKVFGGCMLGGTLNTPEKIEIKNN